MTGIGGDTPRRPPAAAVAASLALILLLVAAPGTPAPPPSGAPQQGNAELLLSVDLEGDPVLDGLVALEKDGTVFLPVCALAEALSLAIRCTERRAYGFVLEESRPFVIDLEGGYLVSVRSVSRTGAAAFAEGGEVYAEVAHLSAWLPLDLAVDRESSSLHVHPRELLPLQGFRKRQQAKRGEPPPLLKQSYQDFTPRRGLASIPTVDLTSQLELSSQGGGRQTVTRHALRLSGDLLYLSGESHVAVDAGELERADLSLSRRQETPFLVGALPVTQLVLGAAQVPSVDGVGAPTATMYGAALSNRPLSGSSQFLSHDIDGYLPEGWDAELLHNGVPVGYQPPSADGMYHFKNLRVHYGINDFKVILHGPFGETRLSEQTFVTDSTTPKGEFLYTLSAAWQTGLTDRGDEGDGGGSQLTYTSDFGLTERLTGSAVAVRRSATCDGEEEYLGLGVRTALGYTLLSLDLLQRFSSDGGNGQLLTVKSSGRYLSDLSFDSTVRLFHDFSSPQFEGESDDPLLALALLKGGTSFEGGEGIRVPVSAQLSLQTRRSGETEVGSAWRVSGGWNGWNAALEADLLYVQREISAAGLLQISTRVQEVSVRGQAGFTVAPDLSPSMVNLSADRELGGGYLLNSALTHDAVAGISGLRIGLSKRMGLLGYSLSAAGDTSGAYSFNVAVSTSLAADRFNTQLVLSSEPLSSFGMVAATAYLPATPGAPAKALPRIGYLVNGGRALTVPGSAGLPVIAYLQPDIPVDITVDLATLEDPFMVPVEEGCHIVPRAGVVSPCRFTMITGGEVDGMVLLRLDSGEVPLKGVQVHLLREGGQGEVAASTVTQESGYYVFKAVRPGRYRVAVPDPERSRLGAAAATPLPVTMPEGGDQVTGNDFLLTLAPRDR